VSRAHVLVDSETTEVGSDSSPYRTLLPSIAVPDPIGPSIHESASLTPSFFMKEIPYRTEYTNHSRALLFVIEN
jgi:hypothetical protein